MKLWLNFSSWTDNHGIEIRLFFSELSSVNFSTRQILLQDSFDSSQGWHEMVNWFGKKLHCVLICTISWKKSLSYHDQPENYGEPNMAAVLSWVINMAMFSLRLFFHHNVIMKWAPFSSISGKDNKKSNDNNLKFIRKYSKSWKL